MLLFSTLQSCPQAFLSFARSFKSCLTILSSRRTFDDSTHPERLFRAGVAHLERLDQTDFVISGLPPVTGADNQWFWIASSPYKNPKVVLFYGGYSLELLDSRTNGLRDIVGSWSAPSYTVETDFRFNRKKYRA
jgi:hypothetical protein